ncbi:Ig-like domain-containing protein [Stenotrophomonas sp. LGBM10]|uniref:Ig-like domain-containing protein n=1 Tax=Stenotrophomonas sp. LGBM10 TaxID=3390038 RepID=UPI00398B61A4
MASASIARAMALLALLLPLPLLAQTYPNPLTNTATVTAPADVGDPSPGNNTATDANALAVQAQLSVTKALLSASPVAAGGAVQYRIQISNAGPSAATGVGVVDTVSSLLTGVTWTCQGTTAASSCAQPSGSGNAINVQVNVAVGDSVVLLVNATAPTATPATVPANSVSLAMPPGTTDPTPGDNTATTPAVPVQPNALVANNDAFPTAIPSATGGNTPTVLGNDTLNGAPVNGANLIIALQNAPAGFTINSAGVIAVPAGAAAGAATLTYQICENTSPTNCATASVSLVIGPTAVNDSFNATGGSASLSSTVAGNDNAPAGATFSAVGAPPSGLTVSSNGNFVYAPAGGILTGTTFQYQVCLPAPNGTVCATGTATIVVNANVLIAVDDSFATPIPAGAGGLTPTVLTNDTFNGGAVPTGQMTLSLVGAPAGFAISANGAIQVPATAAAGPLSLTYRFCENVLPGNCATASASLIVSPDAVNDSVTTPGGGQPATGSLATNDNIASGSSYTLLSAPTRGTVVINADGSFSYTPTGGNTGPDSFTYRVCLPTPNVGVCDAATVTVNVLANQLQAANDVFVTPLQPGTATTVSLLANDTFNGAAVVPGTVALTLTGAPAGYAVNAGGQVLVPAGAAAGAVAFGYQLCEQAAPANCATATVQLVVAPDAVNDAFVATAGVPLAATVAGNDNAPAGAQFSLLGVAAHGSVTVNADGSFTYLAQSTYTGPDSFGYQVCLPAPNGGVCDTATVTINVAAGVIVANDDDFSAAPLSGAGGLTASVLGNDSFNGSAIAPAQAALSLINAPPAGYTLEPNGQLQVPAGAPAGPVTLTYQLCQAGTGNCDTATIAVVIAPDAVADAFTTQVGRPVSGNVAVNDNVATGTTFTVAGATPAGLVFNANGSFTYTPPAQFTGTTTFDYRVCLAAPQAAVCDTATVTLNVNAGTLVANDDDFRAAVLNPAVGGTTNSVLANDTINGAVPPAPADVVLSLIGAPAGYVLNGNGTLSVPGGAAAGAVAFSYQLCEAALPTNCATGGVQLLLGPVAVNDNFSTPVGIPLTGSVAGNDNVPANATFSVSGTVPAGLAFTPNGGFVYTPPVGTQGPVSFAYQACLPAPNATVCAGATATINVNAGTLVANDDDFSAAPINPTVGGTTLSVLANDSLNGTVPPASSDVVLSLVGAPSGYSLANDGTLTVAGGARAGAATLTYQVCEAALQSNCDSAQIRVVVAPLAADDAFSTPAGQLLAGNVGSNDNVPTGAVFSLTVPAPAGLQFGPDGSVLYTPPTGFTGPVTFTYQVCLPAPDSGQCSAATATLFVNAGTLVAVDDDFSATPLPPGGSAPASVLANDALDGVTPPAAGSVNLSLVGAPAGYALDANGVLQVPASAAGGATVLTYQVCEAAVPGNCASATIRVVITPSAGNDAFSTPAGQVLNDTVAGNDNVPPGALFSVTGTTPAGLMFSSSGSFTYTPPVGTTGPVVFTYQVCLPAPNAALCANASATITVNAGTLAAVNDDFSSTPINPVTGGATTSVLSNDSLNGVTPPAVANVVLSLVGAPAGLSITGEGAVVVAAGTPAGAKNLTYQVCEAAAPANCATAGVRVVVAPSAVDDALSTPVGQGITGSVAGNDNAPAGAVFSVVGPAPGGLVFGTNGAVTYTPPVGFTGTESFTYQVCLPAPDTAACATATVALNVNSGTLVAVDDTVAAPIAPGAPSPSVLVNDTLNGVTPLPADVVLSLVGAPAGFSIAGDGTVAVAAGTLAGATTLTYQICEALALTNCDTASVALVVAPAPANDAFSVQAGQTLTATVSGNDNMPVGSTWALQGTPPAGVAFSADGSFTYAPPAGTSGPTSFVYQTCLPAPNAAVCATATVVLNINNGALVATDDSFGPIAPGTVTPSVLGNDALNGVTPPAAASVALSLVGAPAGFTLNADGTVTVAANAAAGATVLNYQLCETAAANNCDTATIALVVRPTAVDDAIVVQAGQANPGNVTGNDNLPAGSTWSVAAPPQGLAFNSNGSFTYTPPAGTVGAVTFSYQACLPAPDAAVCSTATVTLTLAVNAVVANDDTVAAPVTGGAVTPSVLANDALNGVTPPAPATVQLLLVGAPPGFVINNDGTVQVPATATAGATTLTYQLCEAASPTNCDTAALRFVITPAPQNDAFAVQAGGSITNADAGGNDRMPAGSTWAVQGTPPPGLTFNADGTFNYTPPAGTIGAVTFTYQTCLPAPNAGVCGTATVTVNVNLGTLVAADDSFVGIAPGTSTPSVLANDALNGVTPPAAANVQLSLVGAPGGYSIAADGTVTVPAGAAAGAGTLTYQICETAAPTNCDTATVSLVIRPVAQNDAYAVQAGGTISNGNVAANDNAPAGATWTVQGAAPAGLVFNANGTFTYTPPIGTLVPVTFTYQLCLPAPNAALCSTATVTLNISVGNLVASDDTFIGIAPGSSSPGSVLNNDSLNGVSPPNSTTVVLSLVGAPAGFALNAAGEVSVALGVTAGTTLLTYQLCDAIVATNCDTATITVVVSPAPQNDSFAVQAGQTLGNSVAGNDNLPAGSSWALQGTAPAGLAFAAGGTFTYTPPLGTTGPVSFTYQACLPAPYTALCGTATATIAITTGTLVAGDDTFSGVAPGSSSSTSVLANDSLNGVTPPAAADVVLSLVGAPAGFTITPAGTIAVAVGTPAGSTTLTYRICEAAAPANCATASVTVIVSPTPQNDAFSLQAGQTLSNSVATNDSLPPGAAYAVQGTPPTGLSFNADGTFTYTAPVGAVSPVTFTYRACLPAPNAGLCGTAIVTLNINNGALAAGDDTLTGVAPGSTSTASVLANDSLNGVTPPAAADITLSLVGAPGGFAINADGTVNVAAGVIAGPTTITYQLCEVAAPTNCATANVTVVVSPAPQNDAFAVRVGQTLTGSVAGNDGMPAGSSWAVQGSAPNGIAFNADGSFTYTPPTGTLSPVGFTYQTCLPAPYAALCSTATVTLNVNNGQLVAADDTLASVAPGGTSSSSVLANDALNGVTPPAAADVVLSLVGAPTGYAITANGMIVVPTGVVSGPTSLTYQICEAAAPTNCDTASVAVVIAPAPQDDAFSVPVGQTLSTSVASNDNMPAGALWTVVGTAPAGLTLATNGGLTYTPPGGTPSPVTFTYQVCLPAPNATACGTATVTVNINNGTLAAGDDVLGTVVPGGVSGSSVLVNDRLNGVSPPAPASVVLSLVGAPAGFTLDADGMIGVATGVIAGAASLTYQICEAAAPANCDTARVAIVVAPVPQNDSVSARLGQTLTASVAGNDNMPAGSTWTVQGSAPAGLALAADGTFSYTPPAGTTGPVTFTYQACLPAPDAATCGTATVAIAIAGGVLSAVDDAVGSIVPGGASTVSVLANDTLNGVSPPAAADVVLSLVGAPTGYTINPDGTLGVAAGVVSGPITLTYQVCEAAVPSNCATASATAVVAPAPQNDAFSVQVGQTLTASVAGNDAMPAGSVWTVQGVPPAGLTLAADGALSYTPPTGTPSPVSLTYQVCLPAPNAAQCGTATLTININNGTLVAGDDTLSGVAPGGTSSTSVLANDSLNGVSPPAAADVVLSLVGAPAGYTINPDGTLGVGTGVVSGPTTITYQICEAAAPTNCDTASVTVIVTPAPQADAFAVQAGQTLVGTVAGNDGMPAGSVWTVQGAPPAGLTFNADGTFTYAPPLGTVGPVSFIYQVCLPAPNATLCGTATVTLNVNTGTLVAGDDTLSGVAPGGTSSTSVLANDSLNGVSPPAAADVVVTLVGAPAGITLNADGTISVATGVASGRTTLTYQICEAAAPTNCDTASVTLVVSPVPQNDAFPVQAGQTLSNSVATNDALPAGTVYSVQGAAPAGLVFNADGTFTYTAPAGTSGPVTFTYQACLPAPDSALCASASVTITVGAAANIVLAVNDDFTGTPVDPSVGGTIARSVLDNDSFNNVSPPPLGSVIATLTGSTPGYTLNNQGQIMVAAGVQPGQVQLAYQLCENGVPTNCTTAIATVLVQGPVGVLLAVDDSGGPVGPAGRARLLNVFANDTLNTAPLDPAQITFAPVATNALSFSADGWVDVAAGLAPGTYSTSYTLCLRNQPTVCDTGSVTVTVIAGEPGVDAEDDRVEIPQDGVIEIDVLGNDRVNGTPIDPDSVTVTITAPPPYGTATVLPRARIRFAAQANFAGVQAFGYQVCDVADPTECASATVTVTVDPNVLTLVDDAVIADGAGPLAIDVLANDSARAAALDPASLQVVGAPAHGTAQCAAGRCTYTPAAAFAGTDSFRYRVCDVSIPTPQCAEANVAVTVAGQQAVLRLTKVAGKRSVQIGDLVRYTVTIDNVGEVDANGATLLDTLPPGFTFVRGGFAVRDADNDARTSGTQPLRIDGIDVAAGERATVVYYLRVGAGTGTGVHTNRITAIDGENRTIGNVASADVDVTTDPLLDESLIVGSVFDDRNGNGIQDADERGIPGVRIAAVEGLLMETDAFGRYHLVGIPGGQARGRNFILKVDPSTVPAGARFTTPNPLVRRITPGLPVRFDFGVRMPDGALRGAGQDDAGASPRPVRIELGDGVFASGSAALAADRALVLDKAAEALVARGGGRVQITAASGQEGLARQRAQALAAALASRLPAGVAAATTLEVLTGEGAVLHRLRLDDPPEAPASAGRPTGKGR